jgi:rRNA maturation RNase YbeY
MPASTAKISFHFLGVKPSLENRHSLKRFIEDLFKKEKQKLEEIKYIYCSDPYLLEINKKYLNHDFYTDIITFNLANPDQAVNAEIYISIDRVKDNAKQFKSTFKNELHRVIFHGALHLCGYKDKTREQVKLMRKMEEKYLTLYFKVPRRTVS